MHCDNCGEEITGGVYCQRHHTANTCSFECLVELFVDFEIINVERREAIQKSEEGY